MSANPGDRPRGDSFEDKGSPSETKDGDAKHVVSLRRQTDDAIVEEGSPDDVQAPPTPAAKRRWRKAKHAVRSSTRQAPQEEPVDQAPDGGHCSR